MLGPNKGMGPVWLQNDGLKRCSEFHVDVCDPQLADLCCAVLPCTYCLKWEVYGMPDEIGIATFDKDRAYWKGTIFGHTFIAYWENRYGVCYFVVLLDEKQIKATSCNEGVTCRDSSGFVMKTIDYEYGKLSWTRQETQKLPYVQTDDGCMDFFCGTCECAPKELCAILHIKSGSAVLLGEKEIGMDPYIDPKCDGPEWRGSVPVTFNVLKKDIDVYVYLYRDPYTGACILSGVVNKLTLPPKIVTNCKQLDVTYTLYDGSIVRIKSKDCGCQSTEYCQYCCLPMDFSNPTYPGGVIKDIPFSYTGCGGGGSGFFRAQPGDEPCSTEVVFATTFTTGGSMTGTRYQFDFPSGYNCPTTPCSNSLKLFLECTARYDKPGGNTQCSRLWLWVGSLLKQVGDVGESPDGGASGYSWKRVQASTCTCDPVGGVAASIPFDITIDCTAAIIGVNGACAGKPIDCCQVSCGGTLFI
jgi:hypothetical protein